MCRLPLAKRLAALAALVLLVPAAQAQRARPFAGKGDVALVVGISGDTFTRLNPAFGGIGLRYRATDRTVVGASVGFGFESLDSGDQGDDPSARRVSVALWNENHVGSRRGIVSPFIGAGATFRAARQAREATIVDCTEAGCGPPRTAEFTSTQVGVGVGALLGAEVKLARGVTLGAAYTLGIEVETQGFGSPPDLFPTLDDQTVVRIGTGVTELQLSVYF